MQCLGGVHGDGREESGAGGNDSTMDRFVPECWTVCSHRQQEAPIVIKPSLTTATYRWLNDVGHWVTVSRVLYHFAPTYVLT